MIYVRFLGKQLTVFFTSVTTAPQGRGGGGVALPYLAYTGICSWTGYGFQVLEPDILDHAYGLNFQTKKKIIRNISSFLELENQT